MDDQVHQEQKKKQQQQTCDNNNDGPMKQKKKKISILNFENKTSTSKSKSCPDIKRWMSFFFLFLFDLIRIVIRLLH